jgi:adenosylhomocysteine nucleosidase
MIGIICAEVSEINEVLALIESPAKEIVNCFEFTVGTLHGVKCAAVLSGVGKVHAAMCTQALILKYSPDFILNVGVAGSIDKNVKIGDIVVASGTIQHDFDVTAFPGRKKGEISGLQIVEFKCTKWIINKILQCSQNISNLNLHTGTILTGDQFLISPRKLSELKNEFGGIACDMEAGSIGHVCHVNKIDFGIIRSISDNTDTNSASDFETFMANSSKNAALILSSFIRSYRD